MIVVMGDLKAKVGNNDTNREEVMGKFGAMNDNVRGCVSSVVQMGSS